MDRKKGGGCRFQANVKSKLASHHSLRAGLGHSEAWDLEDLVKVGRKLKACPYYASRELKNAAQLVICPYNYLVDPRIRKAMEISVKNQVVVLDEAHNIEDSAREAVSGSFNIDDIAITMKGVLLSLPLTMFSLP
jgi:Fanconi anemia group J protein